VLARSATSPSQIVDRPQYEPTSNIGKPGRAPVAAIAAVHNPSASSSGMNPLVASATSRR
jgi:hypothetical protein